MYVVGVPKVRVEAAVGEWIFLATHTSTSADRTVAEQFAKGGGVILEMSDSSGTADVSWISKFPSEREWLRYGGFEFVYGLACLGALLLTAGPKY